MALPLWTPGRETWSFTPLPVAWAPIGFRDSCFFILCCFGALASPEERGPEGPAVRLVPLALFLAPLSPAGAASLLLLMLFLTMRRAVVAALGASLPG